MLLGFAANGATVVRLKGGDPLVFGRGGEEMETLMARGHEKVRIVWRHRWPCRVGTRIPLTHAAPPRPCDSSPDTSARPPRAVREGKGNGVVDPVDFAVTSADVDTTLVVYMGLATLPSLGEVSGERLPPRDTPAVAVERGTTPGERRVFSTIEHLPDAVVEENSIAHAHHRRQYRSIIAVVAVRDARARPRRRRSATRNTSRREARRRRTPRNGSRGNRRRCGNSERWEGGTRARGARGTRDEASRGDETGRETRSL